MNNVARSRLPRSTRIQSLYWPLRVAILALVGVLGCNRPPTPASSETKTTPQIRLAYFANLTHAQAVLGVHSGEFQQALGNTGLAARVFNAGPSVIEALFAGEIDIAYIGPGPVLNAHARTHGQGIRVIAGVAANGVVIVARRDSGIATVADLKGRTIATPQHGNTQDISARHFLIHDLKQADADNVLPVANSEQLALMQRGQIDAAWAPEPWGARLIHEAGGLLLAEEKDLWPQKRFSLALIVATPEFLAKHPDLVEKILRVHCNWTRRLRTAPEEVLPQLAAALNQLTGKSLSALVFGDAITRTEFVNEPIPDSLEVFARWTFDLGFVRNPPDLTGLVDTTILNKVLSQTSR